MSLTAFERSVFEAFLAPVSSPLLTVGDQYVLPRTNEGEMLYRAVKRIAETEMLPEELRVPEGKLFHYLYQKSKEV